MNATKHERVIEILVTETGNEIMSQIDGWPTVDLDIAGQVIVRPAMLVVD